MQHVDVQLSCWASFESSSSNGSGEIVWMAKQVWAIADCLCDKHQNLKYLPIQIFSPEL